MKNGDLQGLQDMVKDAQASVSDSRTTPGTSGTAESATGKADTPVVTDAPGVGIPEANKTLVAPFKEKAGTWMIYGAFGL